MTNLKWRSCAEQFILTSNNPTTLVRATKESKPTICNRFKLPQWRCNCPGRQVDILLQNLLFPVTDQRGEEGEPLPHQDLLPGVVAMRGIAKGDPIVKMPYNMVSD